MKGKVVIGILLIAVLLVTSTAFARMGKKHRASMEDKFLKKVKMVLMNKEELGLSEGQMKRIKD